MGGENRERFGRFLAEEIRADDFTALEIEAPDRVVAMFEVLYRFRFDTEERAEQVLRHGEHLLRVALQRFEASGNPEQMFELLQVAPTRHLSDPEVLRLRSRARLYEEGRTARRRRFLYAYLVIQAVLVTVVFPFLFINAENGRIQAEIEQATSVDVEPSAERQTLSFRDGLYWSVITAASIGYGDVTPRTTVGRAIAATLGTMGVVTIGVFAGLILSWITPRRLD